MEQGRAIGNGRPSVFKQRGEAVWAVHSGDELCLTRGLRGIAAAALKALIPAGLAFTSAAEATPLRDPIPEAMRGLYGRTASSCNDSNEIAFLDVSAERLAYYEADDFLVLGIEFFGGTAVVMFNGRFTSRQEAAILGEHNVQLVLETRDRLVMYSLADNASEPPARAPRDVWIKCPAGSSATRPRPQ